MAAFQSLLGLTGAHEPTTLQDAVWLGVNRIRMTQVIHISQLSTIAKIDGLSPLPWPHQQKRRSCGSFEDAGLRIAGSHAGPTSLSHEIPHLTRQNGFLTLFSRLRKLDVVLIDLLEKE